tara:strand:- start:62 stop:346 length:285 start_codon:yes stop_codon:yes gene_type:complete
MIQAMLAKKAIDIVLKKVMQKREMKKLRKYVEEDNELDIQVKQLQKTVAKQGKYIEEIEKDNAILKLEVEKLIKDSHPPIKGLEKRLIKIEKRK